MMAKAPATPPDPNIVEKTKQVEAASDAKKTVATETTKQKGMETTEQKAAREAEEKRLKEEKAAEAKEEKEQVNADLDDQILEFRRVIAFTFAQGKSANTGVDDAISDMAKSVSSIATAELTPAKMNAIKLQVGATRLLHPGVDISDMDEFLPQLTAVAATGVDIRRRIAKILGNTVARLKPAVTYVPPEDASKPLSIAAERAAARKEQEEQRKQDRIDKLEADRQAHEAQLDAIDDSKDAQRNTKIVEEARKKAEKDMQDSWRQWAKKVLFENRIKNLKGEGDNLNPLTWPAKTWKHKKTAFVTTLKAVTVVPAKFVYERKVGIALGAGIGSVFPGIGIGTAAGAVVGSLIPPSTFSKKS